MFSRGIFKFLILSYRHTCRNDFAWIFIRCSTNPACYKIRLLSNIYTQTCVYSLLEFLY